MDGGGDSGAHFVQHESSPLVDLTSGTVTNERVGVSTPATVTYAPNNTPRVNRIRFNDHLYVGFLKRITAVKLNVAEGGTFQQKCEEAMTVFISNSPSAALASVTLLMSKMLYEQFQKIVADHRTSTRKAMESSSVAREVT